MAVKRNSLTDRIERKDVFSIFKFYYLFIQQGYLFIYFLAPRDYKQLVV